VRHRSRGFRAAPLPCCARNQQRLTRGRTAAPPPCNGPTDQRPLGAPVGELSTGASLMPGWPASIISPPPTARFAVRARLRPARRRARVSKPPAAPP
jgi:hypothetical protein